VDRPELRRHTDRTGRAPRLGLQGRLRVARLVQVCSGAVSEQGWIEFLQAEGVDDWVVVHGGATAVFRVGSLGQAANLAAAIAEVPGLEAAGTLLTIAADRLTVRLTRGVLQLEPTHVELARAV
jgi:hypothetical protein